MRTIALFCAALLVGVGGPVQAADPQFGDPGGLVNSADTTAIKADVEAGIRYAGILIDAAEANVVLTRHAKDFLRGALDDSFFNLKDSDPPTLRAVRTFLGELRGLVVACKGRVVIKLPMRLEKTVVVGRSYDGFTQQTVVRTQKVPWLNDAYPVNGSRLSLTVGVTSDVTDEEAKSKGESIIYTFQIGIADPRVLEAGVDDQGTEMDRWTSLEGFALEGPTPWQFRVRLKRQPARIEEILPKPPTVEVLNKPPFRLINCKGIPRLSNLTNILQEVLVLTTAPEQSRYLIARSRQGEVDALCALGRLYWLNEHRRSDALRTLEEAALLGSGEAAWELAERYAQGDKVERDREKALRFYTIAAEEGYRALAPKRIEALRAASGPEKPVPVERQP